METLWQHHDNFVESDLKQVQLIVLLEYAHKEDAGKDKMSSPRQNKKSKLQRERERKGWSRKYVAKDLGVSEYTIGQWERGEHKPYPVHIEKLCTLFDTDAETLGLTDIPSKATNDQADIPTSTSLKRRHLLFATLGVVIVLAVALSIIIYVIRPLSPAHIKPGGAWISPVGKTVSDIIHFAAYAYPTNKGDPEIDHVNFTMYWQGVDPRAWKIACVARVPIRNDVFVCDANLKLLGAIPGQIIISFDVYDRQGNVNFAPNGEHTLIYAPSQVMLCCAQRFFL